MTEEQGASEQVESEEVKGGSGGRGLHTHGPGCLQLARVAKRLDTSLSRLSMQIRVNSAI